MPAFRALLLIGYWAGCKDNTGDLATALCPLGYCNYQNESHLLLPRNCKGFTETSICVEHRTGQLCGACEHGYAVYFHSENFMCGECPQGADGLWYILTEVLPVVVLFACIMISKLKMTYAPMLSILLIAQTITLINRFPSVTALSKESSLLVTINTFLLGFLNLDFFQLDKLSFCLWSGATALDNLAFHDVTTLVIIFLLSIYLYICHHTQLSAKIIRKVCCKSAEDWIKRSRLFQNSIVHGIT